MASPSTDLPSGYKALWRSLRLGYRAEPLLLVVAFASTIGAAVPDALFALGFKLLADGAMAHDRALILGVTLALGALATASWFLRVVSARVNQRFADRSTVVIESHVARLQASVPSVEHHERPEYLDRLAMLRDQVFALNHLYLSLFTTAGAVLRLIVTLALLMTVHPALILLGVFAVPAVWLSGWRSALLQTTWQSATVHQRHARHFFVLGTTASPAKEVRVSGVASRLAAERNAAWQRFYAPLAAVRWGTAWWQAGAWTLFGAAYVGAIVFVSSGLGAGAGDVVLVLAAGGRLSQYAGLAVTEAGFLRGIWLESSKRLAWLEDYAGAHRDQADQPVPDRIEKSIRLSAVSFRYPGTERFVLEDIDLELPAGAVVAVVGENGAGKSTLVKLLCRFYEPTHGEITIDGTPLSRVPAEGWRARLAGAFQDFFRFEYTTRQSIGLGDLPRHEDVPAVQTAVGRAGAQDVVEKLARGLETQLGPTWRDGADLSFGQWQKLALARGFMRDTPLLLVLDEPTAALDAETEHALFERFAAAARAQNGRAAGRITVLVSHRFSTVRMADRIIVLDGSRVAEYGTHEQLMSSGGPYSELYGIQAAAYR